LRTSHQWQQVRGAVAERRLLLHMEKGEEEKGEEDKKLKKIHKYETDEKLKMKTKI